MGQAAQALGTLSMTHMVSWEEAGASLDCAASPASRLEDVEGLPQLGWLVSLGHFGRFIVPILSWQIIFMDVV